MDKKYQAMVTSVTESLIKDVGLSKDQLKMEQYVKGAYQVDIMYKDFAFEIDGPFHYIHDHTSLTDTTFHQRK